MSMRHAIGAVLILATLGCADDTERTYEGLTLRERAGSDSANVISDAVYVPLRGFVVLEARPSVHSSGVDFEPWPLELTSERADVAEVRRTIATDTWFINGHQSGTTTVRVHFEGERVDSFRIDVGQ